MTKTGGSGNKPSALVLKPIKSIKKIIRRKYHFYLSFKKQSDLGYLL